MVEFFAVFSLWAFANFIYLVYNNFKIKECDYGVLFFCNAPFITCFIVAIGNWLHS
ncbi:hypothetical protein KP27_017 [Klebsiella phage KP27]|uniref:Uncharacterized protein n=1 Tax=Klebsiella phage KP27 TaxID=1129147 RepID=K7NRH6_9CAUD|nr:hypothetical protein KP27_017 [Klebsiella phage KP27]AEX26494.1 hypothetical protein KP27_017 [Klebsiella phage KP27]